jgi:hypothetical protein
MSILTDALNAGAAWLALTVADELVHARKVHASRRQWGTLVQGQAGGAGGRSALCLEATYGHRSREEGEGTSRISRPGSVEEQKSHA